MCGLEVGCRCVFSNTRGGGRGGRKGRIGDGRKARAELRVRSADMVTSLSSPGAGSNWEGTLAFLNFFFTSSWKHKRAKDYIHRPVLIYKHCSDDHNKGLFKTWALFGSRCFPQLIMMLGCTVYMCFFSFFVHSVCVCVCVCERVPEGTSRCMLRTVSSFIVYDSNAAVPSRDYAPPPSWSKQTQPH